MDILKVKVLSFIVMVCVKIKKVLRKNNIIFGYQTLMTIQIDCVKASLDILIHALADKAKKGG